MFCSVFIFRGQMHMWHFSCLVTIVSCCSWCTRFYLIFNCKWNALKHWWMKCSDTMCSISRTNCSFFMSNKNHFNCANVNWLLYYNVNLWLKRDIYKYQIIVGTVLTKKAAKQQPFACSYHCQLHSRILMTHNTVPTQYLHVYYTENLLFLWSTSTVTLEYSLGVVVRLHPGDTAAIWKEGAAKVLHSNTFIEVR